MTSPNNLDAGKLASLDRLWSEARAGWSVALYLVPDVRDLTGMPATAALDVLTDPVRPSVRFGAAASVGGGAR